VSPVKYELGFYIPEDGILNSHRRENLKSYKVHLKFRCCDSKALWLHADVSKDYTASVFRVIVCRFSTTVIASEFFLGSVFSVMEVCGDMTRRQSTLVAHIKQIQITGRQRTVNL
jgi:hypothetical protein